MSRPASSWSRITVATASLYASSCCTSLNATRTSRPSNCCLNHCGLGYDPTMVVGRMVSTTLLAMSVLSGDDTGCDFRTLEITPGVLVTAVRKNIRAEHKILVRGQGEWKVPRVGRVRRGPNQESGAVRISRRPPKPTPPALD